VIEPAGADGFLHRFLAARGPGLHHVTFKVSSLAAAAARAEAQGYRLVGRDETDPDWLVAYFHPKEALGVVVQLGPRSPPEKAEAGLTVWTSRRSDVRRSNPGRPSRLRPTPSRGTLWPYRSKARSRRSSSRSDWR
jgi:catechol 2,3-dioxygenase-like lactoylglutathione lyase family enzyme